MTLQQLNNKKLEFARRHWQSAKKLYILPGEKMTVEERTLWIINTIDDTPKTTVWSVLLQLLLHLQLEYFNEEKNKFVFLWINFRAHIQTLNLIIDLIKEI